MKTSTGFVLLAIAATAAPQPARADLTIVQTTKIDAPGVQGMLAEVPRAEREPLLKMLSPMLSGAPWVTTTYLKGQKLRTDMGQTTTVVNADTGNQFTLNRQTRAYSIGPYDPFQKSAGTISCLITPTDQTRPILGHTARRYAVAMTNSALPSSAIDGEIWSALDLPAPPSAGFPGGAGALMQAEMSKVQGMPLAFRLVYHNTPAGDITLTSYATQITDSALAAATFTIPDNYHKGTTQTATGMPSTGFPLGDGMPLDSMAAVTNDIATGNASPERGEASTPPGMGIDNVMKTLGLGGSNAMSALGGGPNTASGAAGLSPAALQQLLSAVRDSGGGSGQGLLGGSSGDLGGLSSLLGASGGDASALTGGDGGLGDLSSQLPSPQVLQQMGAQLQSLLNDNGE